MATTALRAFICALLGTVVAGFGLELAVPRRAAAVASRAAEPVATAAGRRAVFDGAAAMLILGALPDLATASGGAMAGKYTIIPIAKRRYFGRVKQGVYEYLTVGAAIKAGELRAEPIENFFSNTIQVSQAKQKRQCIGDDTSCRTKEKFSSRWEDLKLSMYLLGNAFRTDSGKPPEKVKQVKEAQAFFAQEALETFLNDVDLPPTAAPDYAQAADSDAEVTPEMQSLTLQREELRREADATLEALEVQEQGQALLSALGVV